MNEKLCVALKRKWTYQLREGSPANPAKGAKKAKTRMNLTRQAV